VKIKCRLCGKLKPEKEFRRVSPPYCRTCFKKRWETVKQCLDPSKGKYAATVLRFIREGRIKTPFRDAYLRSADKG